MIKIYNCYNFEIPEMDYYELIVIMELGESDRIDISNIEMTHISKFLKNVCILLEDLDKFDKLYHGNIGLQNIILTDELKISGFKPIFI